jgi:hypothetical protein
MQSIVELLILVLSTLHCAEAITQTFSCTSNYYYYYGCGNYGGCSTYPYTQSIRHLE